MDIPESLAKHIPGAIGAGSALLWAKAKTGWKRLIGYFVAGTFASLYGAPVLAKSMSLDQGFAGYLVGVFSIALIAKAFETIDGIKASAVVARILKKLGL